MTDDTLQNQILACTLCAQRFAATRTRHRPAPVVWFGAGARILIAAQAPGIRAHQAARPFADRSGDRLRDWLGLDEAAFYDRDKIAILPASFCFPGYNAHGHDLPPPPICAATWGARARAEIGPVRLRVLVGGYAHRLHLGARGPVARNVENWRDHAPATFVLPHPSWRNNAWLNANPWFAADLLPALRAAVAQALA